jgi:flavodoxin
MNKRRLKMKGLIVFYSRTGKNEAVAKILSEKLNFEFEKIIDKKKRLGIFGFIISGYEALTEKLTEIENLKHDLSNFEHIIIGTPVWAGKITPAVRTFLIKYGKDISFYSIFSVSGFGEKNSKILNDFTKIIGKEPKSNLMLKENEINDLEKLEKFISFIDNIKKA